MTLQATPQLPDLQMTEEEFEAWCTEDVRAEFVDGKVIEMSPVSLIHDRLFHFLDRLLGNYLEVRPGGQVIGPEFQVRLRAGLRRIPDLMFVSESRQGLLQRTYLAGAPDVAFEIVSKESIERDWRDKFHEYESNGVQEYWIIDPAHQTVRLHHLVNGRYQEIPAEDGRLASSVISGFWLKPEWLWQDPTPGALACLREMGVLFFGPAA